MSKSVRARKVCKGKFIPTNDHHAFVQCDCGWEWTGPREEGRRLALRLHKRTCEIAKVATVEVVDWRNQDTPAEEVIRTNPKTKGKKAKKKQRYNERRTGEQELHQNATDMRARVRVENGTETVNPTPYEMEATLREAVAQGKIVIITNEDGVPVGLVGDPATQEYRDMLRALREDGFDMN